MELEQQDYSSELLDAIKAGELSKVKRLLEEGADPNAERNGRTALSLSISYQHKEIALMLLNAGANPDRKNVFGFSPFELAHINNYPEFVKLIGIFKSQNKTRFKKKYFSFHRGMSTKHAHLEYNAFTRDRVFEDQFYKDTIELLEEQVKITRDKVRRKDLGGADKRTNEILIDKALKKDIPLLVEQAKKPYFARMDIKHESGEVVSYYLGSQGMMDDRVYAPQSFLGSVFAQKLIGKHYVKGVGNIEVTLMRQIDNSNGKIHEITDKEWTEDTGYIDPILMNRLNDNAKTKMNEIWETIQGEQDTVVRQGISIPIIVQGSAGSGKTIIALHRLSYLLYNYKNILEEQKITIFGPNMMYIKYIQEAMPHLNIGDITQTTFQQFALERIRLTEKRFRMLSYHAAIQKDLPEIEKLSSKVKGSLKYQKKLQEFLELQREKLVPAEGLLVTTELGDFSFGHEKIKELFQQSIEFSSPDAARNRVIEMLRSEANRFKGAINRNADGQKKLVSTIRRRLSAKVSEFANSWQLPDTFDLYHEFSCNSELIMDCIQEVAQEQIDEFIKLNKDNFARKVFTVDDLPPLLEIERWMTGKIGAYDEHDRSSLTNRKFHYVLMDEAQDYSPYQFSLINSLIHPGRIMLLGDLGQSIYDFRGINSWDEALDALGITSKDAYTLLELSKIYRSTVQIVNFANEIIRPYAEARYSLSEPIGRDGTEPIIEEVADKKEQVRKIELILNQYSKGEYRNIAVITRGWEEAKTLYSALKKRNPNVELITKSSSEYQGGTIVLPVYLTKGIEYDGVIIADASMERFADDNYNRKLLYVAITRALHEVTILYQHSLALPLLDVVDKEAAEAVREEIRQLKLEEERRLEDARRLVEVQHLEEQRRMEEECRLQERDRQEQPGHSTDFIKVVEREFNKILTSHQEEVIVLKSTISRLEEQIKDIQVEQLASLTHKENEPDVEEACDNPFVEIQNEALVRFAFVKGKEEQVYAFLESLVSLDWETRFNVQLSTLKSFILKNDYKASLIVLDVIKDQLFAGHNPSMDSIKFLLDIFNENFLDLSLEIDVIDRLYTKFFSLIGKLVESQAIKPFAGYLEENADYLIDVAFEINELSLLLNMTQVYLGYEQSEQASNILTRLFEEWEFFESQLDTEFFIKLLWYSFYFNLDGFFLDLVSEQVLDMDHPEVQIYYHLYDIVNKQRPNKVPGLFEELKTFTPIERILFQEKFEKDFMEKVK